MLTAKGITIPSTLNPILLKPPLVSLPSDMVSTRSYHRSRQPIDRDAWQDGLATRREYHITQPFARYHSWLAIVTRRTFEPCDAQRADRTD